MEGGGNERPRVRYPAALVNFRPLSESLGWAVETVWERRFAAVRWAAESGGHQRRLRFSWGRGAER